MAKDELDIRLAEELQYSKEQEAENAKLLLCITELEARLKDADAENSKLHGRLSDAQIQLSDLRKLVGQQVAMNQKYGESSTTVIGMTKPIGKDMTAMQVYQVQQKNGDYHKLLATPVPLIPTKSMVYEGLHAAEKWVSTTKSNMIHGALHPDCMVVIYQEMVRQAEKDSLPNYGYSLSSNITDLTTGYTKYKLEKGASDD